jgi:hypothetical protein
MIGALGVADNASDCLFCDVLGVKTGFGWLRRIETCHWGSRASDTRAYDGALSLGPVRVYSRLCVYFVLSASLGIINNCLYGHVSGVLGMSDSLQLGMEVGRMIGLDSCFHGP